MLHLTADQAHEFNLMLAMVDDLLRARDARLHAQADLERYQEKLADATRRADMAALRVDAQRAKLAACLKGTSRLESVTSGVAAL